MWHYFTFNGVKMFRYEYSPRRAQEDALLGIKFYLFFYLLLPLLLSSTALGEEKKKSKMFLLHM